MGYSFTIKVNTFTVNDDSCCSTYIFLHLQMAEYVVAGAKNILSFLE
jgi:hypothetical protein